MDFGTLEKKSCIVVVIVITIVGIVSCAPSLAESSPIRITTSLPNASGKVLQDDARGSKMMRRMILPLLIGILLKVGSLLPVILGKLTLMAIGSILTSKLALVIAGILLIHKIQSDSSWHATAATAASTTPEESYSSYPYRRRIADLRL